MPDSDTSFVHFLKNFFFLFDINQQLLSIQLVICKIHNRERGMISSDDENGPKRRVWHRLGPQQVFLKRFLCRLLKLAARTTSLSFILIHVIFILSYQNQIHTKKTKAQNSRLSGWHNSQSGILVFSNIAPNQ